MTMRKFIIANIIAAAFATDAMGCSLERSTHNNYIFNVFSRTCMDPAYISDIEKYWSSYAGKGNSEEYFSFRGNYDDIRATAKRKNDVQMLTYLKWLNLYVNTCDNMSSDSWNYPTKQEIAKRRQTFTQILNAAKQYGGTKLKSQYALLRMRANMMLGYDSQNLAYWNATASKLQQSVWKEAMKNIYARALSKGGNMLKACDVYASQGDMISIKWVARKYRNLAGIESIYSKNPNSPSLNYLVQDFVNNAQETIDQSKSQDGAGVSEEWMKEINAKIIYKDEVDKFIAFADKVIAEGKTQSPCMWKSASAMLHYLFGEYRNAVADINDALSMEGTPAMKDNARAIRLLALTADNKLDENFSKYVKGELEWLDTNDYGYVKERVVYLNLVPLYIKNNMPEMATALIGMMQREENSMQAEAAKYLDRSYSTYNDYGERLDGMTATETKKYFLFLKANHSDVLENFVVSKVYLDSDYFNDMIGTKFIAEGKLSDAVPYLQNVSQQFINSQRINFYMSQRSYKVERWFKRQKPVDEEGFLYTDFADTYGKPAGNQKLAFCKDLISLVNEYNITRLGEQRDLLAYEIATRLYQASCYGDCWYLTHYGKSSLDSARVNELDYAAKAIQYLNVCKRSTNQKLRYKALYALAFIPIQPWYTTEYDANFNEMICPNRDARQYKAMLDLYNYATQNPYDVDEYTTRCDMLKLFRKAR